MKIFWNGSENFIKFDYLNMDSVELKVKKINILFLYLLFIKVKPNPTILDMAK